MITMLAAGTDVWGPALWRAIHFIALGYPSVPTEADAVAYRSFFESLDKVIPCDVCAKNYRRHFEEIPIDGYLLGDRGGDSPSLFDWTVKLHNVVDAELGKADSEWSSVRAKEALFAGRWTTTPPSGGAAGGAPRRPPPPPPPPTTESPWQLLAIFLAVLLILAALAAILVAKK